MWPDFLASYDVFEESQFLREEIERYDIEKEDYNYDQLLHWPNLHLLSCLLSLSDMEPMSQWSLLPPIRNSIV